MNFCSPFIESESFKSEIFTEQELLDLHFDSCLFEDCDLNYTVFSGCTFSDCRFERCNLTMVKIPETVFEKCEFVDCKMIGINWTEAAWRKSTPKKRMVFPISFLRCTLNYSIFIGLNLSKAKFADCSLCEVGFEDADMEGADFGASDLSGAMFNNTRLNGADLSLARNYTIDVCRNSISRARFSMPEATSLLYALDIKIE